MKRILKVLSCVLAISTLVSPVPLRVEAKFGQSLTTEQKSLIGAGAGVVLAGLDEIVIPSEYNGKKVTESNPNLYPQNFTQTTLSVEEFKQLFCFSFEEILNFNLRYWVHSRNLVDKNALDAVLNMYSLETCGMDYKQ